MHDNKFLFIFFKALFNLFVICIIVSSTNKICNFQVVYIILTIIKIALLLSYLATFYAQQYRHIIVSRIKSKCNVYSMEIEKFRPHAKVCQFDNIWRYYFKIQNFLIKYFFLFKTRNISKFNEIEYL